MVSQQFPPLMWVSMHALVSSWSVSLVEPGKGVGPHEKPLWICCIRKICGWRKLLADIWRAVPAKYLPESSHQSHESLAGGFGSFMVDHCLHDSQALLLLPTWPILADHIQEKILPFLLQNTRLVSKRSMICKSHNKLLSLIRWYVCPCLGLPIMPFLSLGDDP